MTPEEELAVMVPGFEYKGVPFSLPKPVVDYIHELKEDRARALRSVDGLHAQLVAQLTAKEVPTLAQDSPWQCWS